MYVKNLINWLTNINAFIYYVHIPLIYFVLPFELNARELDNHLLLI